MGIFSIGKNTWLKTESMMILSKLFDSISGLHSMSTSSVLLSKKIVNDGWDDLHPLFSGRRNNNPRPHPLVLTIAAIASSFKNDVILQYDIPIVLESFRILIIEATHSEYRNEFGSFDQQLLMLSHEIYQELTADD